MCGSFNLPSTIAHPIVGQQIVVGCHALQRVDDEHHAFLACIRAVVRPNVPKISKSLHFQVEKLIYFISLFLWFKQIKLWNEKLVLQLFTLFDLQLCRRVLWIQLCPSVCLSVKTNRYVVFSVLVYDFFLFFCMNLGLNKYLKLTVNKNVNPLVPGVH